MNRIIGFTILAFIVGSCVDEVNKNKVNHKGNNEKVKFLENKEDLLVEHLETKTSDNVEIVNALSDLKIADQKVEKQINSSEVVDEQINLDKDVIDADLEFVKGGGLLVSDDVVVSSLESVKPMVITFNHLKFNELLQKHVSGNGVVNYDSFKKEEYKLGEYLKMLTSTEPKENWSRNKKLAYYINIYNASTVSLILKNYPVKSIKDIKNALDIPFIKIGKKTISLNYLENKIIRPVFKDPKIHFAVNCGAASCPKLSNNAFSEKNIDTLLQENLERFLKSSGIGIKQNGDKVELSKIFEWYADDFGGKDNLLKWITINSSLNLSKYSFKSFITYDWSLNNK